MTVSVYFVVLVLQLFAITAAQNVTFFWYENTTDTTTQLTNVNLAAIINRSVEIKFIVHGWSEDMTTHYYRKIAKAYLSVTNYNIIFVDYSRISKLDYITASIEVPKVGSDIGDMIIGICKGLNISYDRVHLIGHSMGGQVVGFAGKRVYQQVMFKIARISALDPAGPLFEGALPQNRIAETDAVQVDALHTDGGLFGIIQRVGTMDIYVNGGHSIQPGCPSVIAIPIEMILTILSDPANWTDPLFCSHHRSTYLFIDAITNTNYKALECNTELFLPLCANNDEITYGGYMTNEPGKYYMKTGAIPHV